VTDLALDDELARLYAAALYAILRADGEIDRDESEGLRRVVEQRWQMAIDPEVLFFTTVTSDSFAAAVRARDPFRASATTAPRLIGRALLEDSVALSIAAGGLNEPQVHAMMRYAHALGCTRDDILAASARLEQWME